MTYQTLFPINFSPSMLSDVSRCEMYFFRKHCQKLQGTQTNIHLDAGRIFAKACEIVRTNYFQEQCSVARALVEGLDYIYSCDDIDDSLKNLDKIAFNLEKYFQVFPLENLFKPAKLANGQYAIEYEFVFDLGIPHPDIIGETIKIKGLLDAVYSYGNKYFIVDEKTTQNIFRIPGTKQVDKEKEKNAYRLSQQLICYSWALEQLSLPNVHALIRKVPFLKDYEQAFELEIPITQYMRDIWSKAMYNRIVELVDKYKYFKETGGIPQDSFHPSYDNSCNAYGYICPYSSGCLHEEGEEELFSKYQQTIFSRNAQPILLEDFIKTFSLR